MQTPTQVVASDTRSGRFSDHKRSDIVNPDAWPKAEKKNWDSVTKLTGDVENEGMPCR